MSSREASETSKCRRRRRRLDAVWSPPRSTRDVTGLFALAVASPILLPTLGAQLLDFAFALPMVVCAIATVHCAAAVRRSRGHRSAWVPFTAAAALGAVASAGALGSELLDKSETAAFYLGFAGSICLLLGALNLGVRALARAGFESLSEALTFAALVAAVSVYLVVIPGTHHGDTLLTAVFLVDVGALLVAVLAGIAGGTREQRRIAWTIAATCLAVAVGDGLVSVAASGGIVPVPALTALMWAIGAFSLAAGADLETGGLRTADSEPETDAAGEWWLTMRVILPMGAALAIPAIAFGIWLTGSLSAWALGFFGSFFAVVLLLVFGRQTYLLVDNRRSITRERALSEGMARRNRDLQALTGLASTMTQTLEETPIIERGLGVLQLAGRASSASLHLHGGDSPQLVGVAGAWNEEHGWANGGPDVVDRPLVEKRGGRNVFRLPLEARGNDIGTATLIRGADDEFDSEEVDRLALLANQLAIAVQNARDYCDKLEQAIRDPLTGIYNRRFFYEALEKELARFERYGSPVSLVIFDIDDFKGINDSFGHAVGDDVLRRVTAIVGNLIRPVDSFARLGGEEFGLLLPETQQLNGLLVADRIRAAVARHDIIADRRVTLSGGVASCPQDALTTDQLQKRADAALYWAKRNGKNICAVASEATSRGRREEVDDTLSHLYALVTTIDAEPPHTRDHSENVAAYAVALGQELGLDEERVVSLRRAAFFHDIGKIAVSRSTLAKPGPLDDAEWEEIRIHPLVGRSMLQHAGLDDEALWVGQHHERLDGRGYPHQLREVEIALEARIIFVAEAFEAMTSDRPYRQGMDVEAAVTELRKCAGTQFDPGVVDALCALLERDELTVLALRG